MEDEEMVTQTESEVDETTENEEEQIDSDQDETTDDSYQKYLDQKRRAEKAEAELKALKEKSTKQTAKPKEAQNPTTSQDETFIIAALSSKGMSYTDIDTYLDKAKKIAQIEEIPLKQVLDSEYFKAFDKNYQEEKKRELASLGASKGSGGSTAKKTLQTPGLSDEEFNALLRKEIIG